LLLKQSTTNRQRCWHPAFKKIAQLGVPGNASKCTLADPSDVATAPVRDRQTVS